MGAMAGDLVALVKALLHENLVNLLENYMPQVEMVQAVIVKPRQIRFPIAEMVVAVVVLTQMVVLVAQVSSSSVMQGGLRNGKDNGTY